MHSNAIDAARMISALRGTRYPAGEAELAASPIYTSPQAWISVDLGAAHLVSAVNLYLEKNYEIPGEKKTEVLTNAREDSIDTADLCEEKKVQNADAARRDALMS